MEVVIKCILYCIINYVFDFVFMFYSFYNVEKVLDSDNIEISKVCIELVKVV